MLTANTTIGYPAWTSPCWSTIRCSASFRCATLVAIGAVRGRRRASWPSTRVGRDVIAVGSDPRAALVAGVERRPHPHRGVRGLGRAHRARRSLLSYSLAAASPVALADTLVPATAAAIIGGVSLPAAGHAGRHCRRRPGPGRAALRSHGDRRAALCARYRHRRRAARGRAARRRRPRAAAVRPSPGIGNGARSEEPAGVSALRSSLANTVVFCRMDYNREFAI